MDIIERLDDEEMYVDAIDDAIEEILKVRGMIERAIKAYQHEDMRLLEIVIGDMNEYMYPTEIRK